MTLRSILSRFAGSDSERHAGAVRRDGFALPMAIMVLALLTMGLVAGFAATSSEISSNGSQRAQARAYSYAQAGLEAFLTQRKRVENGAGAVDTFCKHCWLMNKSNPNGGGVDPQLDTLPTRKETVYVAFNGGSAVVRAVPVRLNVATGRGTYFITSTGTDGSSATLTGMGKSRQASRTVGVFVTWNRSTMNVMGALTSFSGIQKNGSGFISGNDQCGRDTNIAGINIPLQENMNVNGGFAPTGNPPYDTLKTFAQDSAASKLDWGSIRTGSNMPADIDIGPGFGGSFPNSSAFADTNYWPVIHVHNNPGSVFALKQGRGMLIVDNDLSISGSNMWDGVILVGGQLTSNGNNTTSGAVMSGLNELIGHPAGPVVDATLNGTKSYQYNSCSVKKATSAMARYTVMPNTWMDNVTGY